MAQALGYKLLDADGGPIGLGGAALSKIRSISSEDVDPRLLKARIRVACDVTNPLLGRNGASRVYGPQKGATPEMVERLEANLKLLAQAWKDAGLLQSADNPGDGAAGGLGAGLRAFCKAEIVSGARLIMDAVGFESQLAGAALLITGEGCTDSQTRCGKLCAELAKAAKRQESLRCSSPAPSKGMS